MPMGTAMGRLDPGKTEFKFAIGEHCARISIGQGDKE